MAVCPNCGHRELFLHPLTCEGCRKVGCDRCLGAYAYTYPVVGEPAVAHRVCSWDCFDRMATYNVGKGLTITPSGGYWYFGSYQLVPEAAQHAVRIQAEHFVLAERHEDAARLFEAVGMWKEAGDTRRLGARQVVTQIHVDVNDLVAQLRAMGVTATYTCPACHSPLEITPDTKPDALAKCAHCGAVIMPTDLVQAIAKVVGYR
ncbi:MAG TPA: hypothetical protein VEY12_08080 [Thermoplasmata archaeon]|nr:hypothetical protein [Thermoplasmata archaeon]